jgi:putative CocE/NonD family hydrolase
MRHLWNARVPMRDGVHLSADVYLPDVEGSYPAVVIGTPYDNTMKSHVDMASFFVSHDYAFIVYDVRGRYDSDGDFYPFFNEGPDGHDLIEWAASQPWCNGKLGMMGGSYRGWIQWAAAKEQPPHLTTMIPTATGGNWLREFPLFNGIPCLWMFGWLNFVGARTNQSQAGTTADWERIYNTLPINELPEALGRKLPYWKEWMSHPDMDDFWKRIIFTPEDFKGISIPVLHITGYYDGDQPGALHYYKGAVEHGPKPMQQYMLMGPWDHAGTRFPKRHLGGVDFTTESLMDMKYVHLEWFDHWLKGKDNGVKDWPLTKYYVINENRWIESDTHWPIEPDRTPYYLDGEGKANTYNGDGKLTVKPGADQHDTYIYNPENPAMPTKSFDFYGAGEEVPLDRRYMMRRDDHLVYTSEALDSPVTIKGSPVTELYVSSDCPDTDFFVYLMDVYPDGRSVLVSQGLMRARYRNGLEKQELMKSGEVYKVVIPMSTTGNRFKKGHKMRLSITSSEFPRYGRNNNTGNRVDTDTEIRIAENTVYLGGKYPSRLLLPIV